MSAMVRRAVVVAVVVTVGALVAQAQPCNCPTVPAVEIDWLGALTGCKPGGAPCATGETISFTLKSLGRPFQVCDVFDWDFGDGTAHSTLQNPTHVFTTPLEDTRVIFLITNCSVTFNGDARPLNVVPLTALPTIVVFTTSSASVLPGQWVTFTWNTANGSKGVRIENDPPTVPAIVKIDRGAIGSFTFAPQQSMTYTLTAFGDAGQRTERRRVEVLKRHRAARR